MWRNISTCIYGRRKIIETDQQDEKKLAGELTKKKLSDNGCNGRKVPAHRHIKLNESC